MRLTDEQAAAATAAGSVAVAAGAGTGKTHLLVGRYLHHLTEEQLSPLEVVAVTFTRRAASELRARLRAAIAARSPENPALVAEIEAAPIGTLHSLCARICQDHPLESGAPVGFEILDEREGRLAALDWFRAAVDRLPASILERIPFQILEQALPPLLSDPTIAELAFAAGGEAGGRWAELAARGRRRQIEELGGDREWRQAVETLASLAGSAGDGRETVRRAALAAASRLGAGGGAGELEEIASLTLRGGIERNWPDGGFTEVRAAIETLRRVARARLETMRGYALGTANERLAAMLPDLREAFIRVRDEMERARRAAGRLDYGDLEVMARRALDHDHVRHYYTERWRAFLVDEFQDTNRLQAELLELLTAKASLTIVGDENQSIYGFRRAEREIFARCREQIIAGGGTECRLTISFRHHQELAQSLQLIFSAPDGASDRRGAESREMAVEPLTARIGAPHDAPHVRLLTVAAAGRENKESRQRREAAAVAAELRRMLRERRMIHDRESGEDRPLEPADVAILARTWRPLEIFREALEEHGLPAVNVGGGDLLRTREAQDIVALLRFLANPGDDTALIALLRGPFFAISDRVIQGRRRPGVKNGWWQELQPLAVGEVGRAAGILQRLLDERGILSASQSIRLADRLTGYSAVIGNLPGAARRMADWRGMRDWVMANEGRFGGDVFGVWRHLRRMIASEVTIARPPAETGKAIALMTIHAAKGLEWPLVVIPDLSGGTRMAAPAVFADPELGVALRLDDGDEKRPPVLYTWLEEEARRRERAERGRLLYVGLTRARDALLLSAADPEGGMLDELRSGLLRAGVSPELIVPASSPAEHETIPDLVGAGGWS